jgi:PAS domain S-box-containing protein
MSDVEKHCTYLNQGWLDFTGRPLEEELETGWARGIHPEDIEPFVDTCTNAFDRREPFTTEYRLLRNDGEYRWILVQAAPRFGPDGSFAGYIGSGVDVTERKLAEEALSTVSQKLIEAQEQERSRLARELHDDINQQLALLAVNLETLKESLPTGAVESARQLDEAGEKVMNLGKDIQALSHGLHSSKLELLGLTRAAASFCKELSTRQGVEISFHSQNVPRELPNEVALSLFRVLQESLQNAIKHSGARHFQVSLRCAANELELTVKDSGIGFEPEEAFKGHGLGLTSMQERLRLVDGQLAIDSKPQHGTTVRACVRLRDTAQAAQVEWLRVKENGDGIEGL